MKEFLTHALIGHGVVVPIAAFAFAGALVFAIASRLAEHADAIADASGLGRLWIGSLLLAGSTSLPEIVTDVNSAALAVPNIGVGDLLGSTLSNMLILALLVIFYERAKLLRSVAIDHALVGALGIVLTALAGLSIVSGGLGRIGFVGVDTACIAIVYVIGMRVVFDLTRHVASAPREESPAEERKHPRRLLRKGVIGFGLAAAGLAAVAPLLVLSAEAVAKEAGLSDTFVGTALVGMTTSFPEMAAAIVAVRIGAADLAVGNIFGSNAFNMTILLPMDLAYRGKPILSAVSRAHAITSFAAIGALALGVMAILARTHSRVWVARSFASLIIAIYFLSLYVLAFRADAHVG